MNMEIEVSETRHIAVLDLSANEDQDAFQSNELHLPLSGPLIHFTLGSHAHYMITHTYWLLSHVLTLRYSYTSLP